MARQLGVSSQLYGMYERGEREPGASFFVSWKRVFGEDLTGEFETIVPRDTVSDRNDEHEVPHTGPEYMTAYIRAILDQKRILEDTKRILEDQNQFLRRNFEVSLNSIAKSQDAVLLQLKTVAWFQADTRAEGDQRKVDEQLARMGNKANELAGISEKKDTPTGN